MPGIEEALKGRAFLGSDDFLQQTQGLLKLGIAEIPRSQPRLATLPLELYQNQAVTPHEAMTMPLLLAIKC